MTKKPAMPSPDAVGAEMTRVFKAAIEIALLARDVDRAYADAYDSAFRKNGSTDTKPIGRGNFMGTDPTGDVATSGMHKRMRWRVRQAARQLRKITPYLEEASDVLVEAWAEQDPEFQEKLRRLRQLEKEISNG